jgi:hypothetical protein
VSWDIWAILIEIALLGNEDRSKLLRAELGDSPKTNYLIIDAGSRRKRVSMKRCIALYFWPPKLLEDIMRITFLLAVGGLLLLGNSIHAATVFSDDFNSGASASWSNSRGSWSAAGGVYNATSPNNNPATYSAVLSGLTDFAVDVDVNSVSDGGIWLRSSFGGSGISGILLVTGGHGNTGTGFYWHSVTNDSFSSVGSPSNSNLFAQGDNIHVRVEVSGNTYKAFLNGSSTPATTLVDNTFTSGSVGLYDFAGAPNPNQTFDNFVVAAVPTPSAVLGGLPLLAGLAVMKLRRKTLLV